MDLTLAEAILISKLQSKGIPECVARYIVSFLGLKQRQAYRACLATHVRHRASSGDMELAMYGEYLVYRGPAFLGRKGHLAHP